MDTIFDVLSIDRKKVHWEDYFYRQTPVEFVDGVFFKREDRFAPLGYGGINGSKLRQCIWLVDEYVKNSSNPVGIISGTSVKSPQLPMGSAVAKHFNLKSTHVIGAPRNTAGKHENVAMATWFGAKFYLNKSGVAYNPVLQKRVQQLMRSEKEFQDYFYLEYGITVDHHAPWNTPERVEAFHRLGAEQVRNIPDDVETLVLPAGSCNSCTSILYGLSKYKPKNLKNVYLIGIGPNKIDFVEERLDICSRVSGVETKIYERQYHDSPVIQEKYNSSLFVAERPQMTLHHYDLHTTKYCDYQDRITYRHGDIEFHPTYEGKMMTYIKERLPFLFDEKTLIWIVGSEPKKENMENLLKKTLGEYPTDIDEYEAELSACA